MTLALSMIVRDAAADLECCLESARNAVDEILVEVLTEYKDKPLRSAGKGAVDLGTAEEREQAEVSRKAQAEKHASLFEALQKALDDHVKEVRVSRPGDE